LLEADRLVEDEEHYFPWEKKLKQPVPQHKSSTSAEMNSLARISNIRAGERVQRKSEVWDIKVVMTRTENHIR
jgi:hypothetical protein